MMEMFAHNDYFIFLLATMGLAVLSCFSAGIIGLVNHRRKTTSITVMALPFAIFFVPSLLQQLLNLSRPVAFVLSATVILGITLFFMFKLTDIKSIRILTWVTIISGISCLSAYLLIPVLAPA
jgi:hypothetical protein